MGEVKQQYLGDVNDYRKYALLRHFADGGRVKIGVCWMLTPDDEGPDGRKTAYLSDPQKWRGHDPELFDLLQRLVLGSEERLLNRIEASGIIPGATFFDEVVPDSADLLLSQSLRRSLHVWRYRSVAKVAFAKNFLTLRPRHSAASFRAACGSGGPSGRRPA